MLYDFTNIIDFLAGPGLVEAFIFNAVQIITSLLGLILSLVAVINEMFN